MKRLFAILCSFLLVQTLASQDVLSEEQLYFTVSASRTHVYEQEAVLLTYTFHAYGGMGISVGMNSKPDFEGLVSQEISQPQQKAVYTEHVGGRLQRAGVVKQSLVYPQRSGRIVVPGLTFNCEVRVGEGVLGAAMKVKRRVPDVVLEVEPLPRPIPSRFKGAVGQFEVGSSLSQSVAKTGDIVTRVLEVRGKGNLRLIAPQNLTFPSEFDAFDPTVDDHVKVSTEGMQGSVSFNYAFMPRGVGNFTLPADTFCYFNPQSRAYCFVPLAAQTIKVTQGLRSQADIQAEEAMRRSDIRPDHEASSFAISEEYGMALWCASVVILFALTAGVHIALKRRAKKRVIQRGVAGAANRAENGLAKVKLLFQNGERTAALSALEETLTDYAQEYLGWVYLVSHQEIGDALLRHGFDQSSVSAYLQLLNDIDTARFAPLSAGADQENSLLQRAAVVLKLLSPKS